MKEDQPLQQEATTPTNLIVIPLVAPSPREKYQEQLEKLTQYTIGQRIKKISQLPEDKRPTKIVLAVYGPTGCGKSTLANYLIQVAQDNSIFSYFFVSGDAKQGTFSFEIADLTKNSCICDTRGSNMDSNSKDKDDYLIEILLQLAAMKAYGFVYRENEDKNQIISKLKPYVSALKETPQRIHLPILCIALNAKEEQISAVSQIIYKLRQLNIKPVLCITKIDLKNTIDEFKTKSEEQIIETYSKRMSLHVDYIFIFKCYLSAKEERKYEEEANAVKNLCTLFELAEPNMLYEPCDTNICELLKEEDEEEEEVKSKAKTKETVPKPPTVVTTNNNNNAKTAASTIMFFAPWFVIVILTVVLLFNYNRNLFIQ